jgi:hypothetical protein
MADSEGGYKIDKEHGQIIAVETMEMLDSFSFKYFPSALCFLKYIISAVP